ncbi:MAG: hypothetical protein HY519_00505 [Candidatus Aenigmarchaeota archaeon]|nr:hypothetical protein [Candidatus Aenigmarchaeota archaeon]
MSKGSNVVRNDDSRAGVEVVLSRRRGGELFAHFCKHQRGQKVLTAVFSVRPGGRLDSAIQHFRNGGTTVVRDQKVLEPLAAAVAKMREEGGFEGLPPAPEMSELFEPM